MLGLIETASDKLLSLLVPQVAAVADPGCECAGEGGKTERPYCYCGDCNGNNSFGHRTYSNCTCDGCHWNCSVCKDSFLTVCVCP